MRIGAILTLASLAWALSSGCGAPSGNSLLLGAKTKASAEVAIAPVPPAKFDGKSREELFAMRSRQVLDHPELVAPGYKPRDEVFALLEDGSPWWGLEGVYFYSAGPRSTEGLSEESRFLLNPLLLVAVREPLAWKHDKPEGAADYFPRLLSLSWSPKISAGHATFDVSTHFDFVSRNGYAYPDGADRSLLMVAYNARDFGYHYLALDAVASENAAMLQPTSAPLPIVQFIHKGGSCRFGHGCNNMSPIRRDFLLKVTATPATAVFKLWKSEPASADQAPESTFSLELK